MVVNYKEHGFSVAAERKPESCTACPFWVVDMKNTEIGGCYITGREILANGPQDEERMDDCPIRTGCDSKTEERDVVFRRCICDYGTQPQVDVAIEEMSELTKALLKWRRAKGAELTKAREDIIDEIADVRIMCRQMEILFQAEWEVERRIDFKVDRQRKRLDSVGGGSNGR